MSLSLILAIAFVVLNLIIIAIILSAPSRRKGCPACRRASGLHRLEDSLTTRFTRLFWENLTRCECGHCGWRGFMK